jgi:DNA end-binding protein Ku
MPRAIWKGALSFGLVYIPVELHGAAHAGAIDLTMLDRRDFAPVGYQRVNKRTGAQVAWGDIVKGYQYKKGEYVALSEEDFRQANVKASQTLQIDSFVRLQDIAPQYFETPYYLSAAKGGEKVYELLRATLEHSGKVGVGTLVMRGRQHLGAITAQGRALMLITLRFADEIRSAADAEAGGAGKRSRPGARELAMAQRLISEMTQSWEPQRYHDTYREDLMRRIREKIRKKQMHVLTPKARERAASGKSAEVIDLVSILKKSIAERGAAAAQAQGRRPAARRRRRA